VFIGHFAFAFLLWHFFPTVPLPIILISVGFPDLLWSLLVPAGLERVRIDPDSALQKNIQFLYYPYSHSLVLTNLWSILAGVALSVVLANPLVLPVFVAGSVSHWLLDTVVHLKDLPVLGFNGDRKVGAGLWNRGATAFVVEYAFYVIVTVYSLTGLALFYALDLGTLFALINLPSFVSKRRKNIAKTSNGYAMLALAGFGFFTIIASVII
jgi:hypothetical protein